MALLDFLKKFVKADPSSLGDGPDQAFFVSTFALLGKLSMADGVLDERERRVVENFIDSSLNLSPERRKQALDIFDAAPRDGREVTEYARHLADNFPSSELMKEALLDILMVVAFADETFADTEESMLLQIAETFGINRTAYEQLKVHHKNAQGLPIEGRLYSILGCSPDCPDEELITAYKRLVLRYDPEKVIESGVPQDFVLVARKKLESIEESFGVICARRNIDTDEF